MADGLGGIAAARELQQKYKVYEIGQFVNESTKYKLDKSVYLECGYVDPDGKKTEVEAVQEIAEKHGFPHGIIGRAALEADDIESVLQKQMKSPNFRGIRAAVCYHPKYPGRSWGERDDLMMDPNFHRGLKCMAKNGLILDLHIYPQQLNYGSIIAASYPNLRIVINHCGYPLVENLQDLVIWDKGMKLMSKCDNVFVKLSGWCIADPNFNKDTVKFITKTLISMFGVDRCMFASNFPVDKPLGSYDMYWDMYIQILQELSFGETDIDKLIHKNAIKTYRLNKNLQSKL
eukprot:353711_1